MPVVLLALVAAARPVPAAVVWEPPQRVPASEQHSAWFPTLGVDSRGRVHLLWSDTAHGPQPGRPTPIKGNRGNHEQIAYAVRDADGWSEPRLIAIGQQPIYRQSLAVDARDRLHLLFRYSPGSGLDIYYRQALADEGFAPGDWGRPRLVNFRWNAYAADIAVRGDTLHMVFDDVGTLDPACRVCADIFYRRSSDGGDTWSAPVSLRPSPVGGARERIFADAAGVLHVTWDEGWDRQSGHGKPQSGVHLLSPDGGETWSAPTVVSGPHDSNAQLTAGSDGKGGVLLVWRTTEAEYPGIYFQWSTDWGATWSAPAAIPGITARGWGSPFDRYYAAADGAGRIHLLAGGVTATQQRTGLYHLEWDGARWSTPAAVYEGEWIPEHPQIVIDASGGVHATWYLRAAAFGEEVPHQVWYARGRLSDPPAPAPLAVPVIDRALAPAPTPVELWPKPTPESGLRVNREIALVLLVSVLLGFVIAFVSDRVVRRRVAG
jgi:hypothetical protein